MSHFPSCFDILNIEKKNEWRRPQKALRHFSCGNRRTTSKATDKSVRPTQASLVFENEVKHQQDSDKEQHRQGQNQRPVGDR
jgi:hypothetical protein